jgi:hypothetical protein
MSTTSLGGSSIFGPMVKFHAVGQDKYTKVCITVYIHAAILAENIVELRCLCHLVHMVPPVLWAASSRCCGPIPNTVMRVLVKEARTTSSSAWPQ